MDRYIPIVGVGSATVFIKLCDEFKYAILPYYEFRNSPNILKNLLSSCTNTLFILSSIMPDEYLVEEDIIEEFKLFSSRYSFNYIIAWDMPTYLTDYDGSRINTEKSISYIDYLSREFDVIPLAKGAYPEHLQYSCGEIYGRGFKTIAFHISEYLYSRAKPWPYIKDYSLTSYGYMMHLLKIILEYPFNEVILIGGASPRYYRDLIQLDGRIRLAGYTWYIDGVKYQLYTPEGSILNLKDKFYLCNCRVCRENPVSRLRDPGNISLHNLLINKYLVEGLEDKLYKIRLEIYDLILDTYEDLMIINELKVGSGYSIWRKAFNIVERYKPKYLIIMGNLISPHDRVSYDEYKDLIETLTELSQETKIFYIPRYISKSRWITSILYKIYLEDVDAINDKLKVIDEAGILERLTRLLLTAKKKMVIKKLTWDEPFTIEVWLYGPTDESFEKAVEEIKKIRKEHEWLITNYINKPYIDYEDKIATPGEWHREWDRYEAPEPGAIYLTTEGEIKIIKPGGD